MHAKGDLNLWLEPIEDGCIRIVAKHSGKTVQDGSLQPGAQAIQYV